MPTSSQHSIRVKQGLDSVNTALAKEHPNELVIACFYTCLHMFEAALYDFGTEEQPRHFNTHRDRYKFPSAASSDSSSAFFELALDYQSLRDVSEQARYLSPAGSETYEPLITTDVESARTLYEAIKKKLESQYQQRLKNPAPWLPESTGGTAAPQQG